MRLTNLVKRVCQFCPSNLDSTVTGLELILLQYFFRRNKMTINLKNFDVPESRKDLNNPSNIRWLLRNLAIRNKNNPRFETVFNELKSLTNGFL